MVHHFFNHRFELRHVADLFQQKYRDRYEVVTTLDPAHVETPDFASAYTVAEFMLNLLQMRHPPRRQDVEPISTPISPPPTAGIAFPCTRIFSRSAPGAKHFVT
jgi:hypothetical protein